MREHSGAAAVERRGVEAERMNGEIGGVADSKSVTSIMARDEDAAALRVLVVSLPAYGHYMTIRDLAVGLAARGHAVTFALCERNRAVFDADAAEGRVAGVAFLSAGPCPSFAASDETIRALIARPRQFR